MELLSVIVPVYNVEEYLDKCVASIVAQTYRMLEIILIDDGSDDNSGKLCDEWKKRDSRIVVVHKKNEGLVKARKTGVQLAKGSYIGYVDADDWIEPNMYEVLMQVIQRQGCDIVASGRIEEYPTESRVCPNQLEEGLYLGEKKQRLYSSMLCTEGGRLFSLYPTVWDKVFKRDALYEWQMKVPDELRVGEDVACVYPALLHAKGICIVNDCFYHYNRCRANSMLRTKDSAYFYRTQLIFEYLSGVFQKFDGSLKLQKQLENYVRDLVLYGVTNEFGIRLGNPVQHGTKYLFPYEMIPQGARVVLYGGGNVGRELARQIRWNRYCEIVAWVDEKAEELELDSIECLMELDYDYIIIGTTKLLAVEEIRKKIQELGVEERKVIWKDYRLAEA